MAESTTTHTQQGRDAASECYRFRWSRLLTVVGLLLLILQTPPAIAAQAALDLPACEASAPGMDSGISLGLTQPHAAPATVAYAAALAIERDGIEVCSESWHRVLPKLVPWAPALERGIGFGAFMLAFLIAIAALHSVTPKHWWFRTTLLGVISVAGVTWLFGVGMLIGFDLLGGQRLIYDTAVSLRLPRQAKPEWFDVADARALEALLDSRGYLPRSAMAPKVRAIAADTKPVAPADAPGGEYLVRHRLNLRAGPGVQTEWLAIVERGKKLSYDGAREGDWWRVRTSAGQVGWASSLWLRRPTEATVKAERG